MGSGLPGFPPQDDEEPPPQDDGLPQEEPPPQEAEVSPELPVEDPPPESAAHQPGGVGSPPTPCADAGPRTPAAPAPGPPPTPCERRAPGGVCRPVQERDIPRITDQMTREAIVRTNPKASTSTTAMAVPRSADAVHRLLAPCPAAGAPEALLEQVQR